MRRVRGRLRGRATLRGRLALVALATTAVWVTLLTAAFNLALTARLREQADDLLRTRAEAVAATVETRPDGEIVVHEPSDDQALDTGIWVYQGRRTVERPSAPAALQASADRLVARRETFLETADPSASRLYALPLKAGHRQVGTVVAAVGLDPYRSTARSALAGSAVLALLLLAGIYLVSRVVVGRALRPVGAMSAQAAQWSEYGTARRFGADDRPAELAGLAVNLDELLDRLAAVLRHEQQLTAELSHELRTPLARLTAETDWLTARPRDTAEQHASHQAIAASAARMQQICEALLTDARTGSGQLPGRCSPLEVAGELARRRAEEHPQDPPVIVVGDAARAGVSAAVLERILTPLLDNAGRYAERRITVKCAQRPGGVEVAVSDDGPGVPEDVGAAVFEAGRRADPGDGHRGAGLGLALSRRLTRAAGGEITLADSPSGARFVVSLPAG
ncbi:sensor histidine kinase [Streptomyces sp. H27-D2]|uniref:sensor histidine kinase n=1 Tax=Streptomyces sp. H27-D2 TaxID=3046304 RepID=UPI002DBE3F78|nr:HAMP domain-containing sensor histidine kinase [Streptomyces sp. H27-D2]MEC4015390.1 HAMP domain-containing sensor histidine kinase [Streptomyces sp. H27-D2]